MILGPSHEPEEEMALGIAAALAAWTLDPLPVQMRGLSLSDAAYLIRAVVRECSDAEISLHSVKVDAELFAWLTADGTPMIACTLAAGADPGEVLFQRKR